MQGLVKRKPKHVSAVVDYVRHCGGDDPVVTANGHLHVDWIFEGRPLRISMSSSPKSGDACERNAKQAVRRAYRGIGVEVLA